MSSFNLAKNSLTSINTLVSTLNYVPSFGEHGKQILEPLICMIRLAILYYKDENTKISICNNRINYQTFTIFQGAMRWSNGDKRSDLHNLYEPIRKALKWYDINDEKISFIFKQSIGGLYSLINTYKNDNTNNSNLVCHSLSYYIDIIKKSLDNSVFKQNEENSNIDDNKNSNLGDNKNNNHNNQNNNKNNNHQNNNEIDSNHQSKKKKKKKKNKSQPIEIQSSEINDRKINIMPKIDEESNDTLHCESDTDSEDDNFYMNTHRRRKLKKDKDKLSKIWSSKEIDIIYHILVLINLKKKTGDDYLYLLEAIECILNDKDIRVYNIIQKISTSLDK